MTSPGTRQRRQGIVVHVSERIARVTTVRFGIPCTRLPRTLVDIAGSEPIETTRRAWSTCASRRLLDFRQIAHEIRDHPHRPGVAATHTLLAEHDQIVQGRTRSELEAAAIRMCQRYRLPAPSVNALIHLDDVVYEADLAWPAAQLVVEVDTWRTHGHAGAFRSDRQRDLAFASHGWQTVRLLEDSIVRRPRQTTDQLRRMIEARSRTTASRG